MELISIILILVLVFLIFKNFKHIIFRKSLKVFTIIIILFLILAISSYFYNFNDVMGKESLVTQTGASIVNVIKNGVNENEFVQKESLEEVAFEGKDFIENKLIEAKNSEIARKIYK